ncbi:signal peptidase I [Sporosarcina sp. P13]|uniref:S26 family signal peptidase n=1 Tax=Sporosarcina sp. P13 TaxID=2048263 RepID=UPI000C171488|nr:S26 family signal peptidase [Sporosarcina sp. P13]PIC62922.1 signal peptidase I [Sporosarcina sp. P13]
MSDFKRKLDQMMGDTSDQERRIKQRVHEELQPTGKKHSWRVLVVTAALPVVALLLIMTFIPSNLLSSDEGRGVPYDPLDDMAQISALQKKQMLSSIDYEEFAKLPHFDTVDGLNYVDKTPFTLQGSSDTYHTVIERQANLFDDIVYEAGDIVRTMTNTSSHLPTFDDVYYEVLAIPGDRVVLKNGELTINGKPVDTEIMERYKERDIQIAGGYDQLLNAREYFLLNHFPRSESVQGATITPVHKIYGQVVGVATEEKTRSVYLDYLSGQLTGDYKPEQIFDVYLYDELFGLRDLPQTAGFAQISRKPEMFLEASYRKVTMRSDNQVEIRYQYGRQGVAEHVFTMGRDASSGRWVVED